MNLTKKIIQTKDCEIAVHMTPERPGSPKLFCVPGGPGFGHLSLLPGILSLQELFDLVLIDPRGEGNSSKPISGIYNLTDYANDVLEIKKALYSNQKCGLFGHSFGGVVAIQTLSQSLSDFSFSILSNTVLNDSWLESAKKATALLSNAGILGAFEEQFEKQPADNLFKEISLLYSPLYFPELSDQEAKNIMEVWTYRAAPFIFASQKIFSGMNLTSECKKISVPTLIIGSSLDKVMPWSCQVELSNEIKSSDLVRMLDCGHFPFITKQNEFLKTVQNFWTKAKGVL